MPVFERFRTSQTSRIQIRLEDVPPELILEPARNLVRELERLARGRTPGIVLMAETETVDWQHRLLLQSLSELRTALAELGSVALGGQCCSLGQRNLDISLYLDDLAQLTLALFASLGVSPAPDMEFSTIDWDSARRLQGPLNDALNLLEKSWRASLGDPDHVDLRIHIFEPLVGLSEEISVLNSVDFDDELASTLFWRTAACRSRIRRALFRVSPQDHPERLQKALDRARGVFFASDLDGLSHMELARAYANRLESIGRDGLDHWDRTSPMTIRQIASYLYGTNHASAQKKARRLVTETKLVAVLESHDFPNAARYVLRKSELDLFRETFPTCPTDDPSETD